MLELAVLASLATWRLTSLFHSEDGLFGVARWLRTKLGIQHDEKGEPVAYPSWLEGFSCFWCLANGVAALLAGAIVLVLHYPFWQWVILWLASATGAIMCEKWIARSKARLW